MSAMSHQFDLVRFLLEKVYYSPCVLQAVTPIRERKELVGQGGFFLLLI